MSNDVFLLILSQISAKIVLIYRIINIKIMHVRDRLLRTITKNHGHSYKELYKKN